MPTIRSTLPAAILLGATGLIGLGYLFTETLPTLWPRWLFFFFSVFALSGLFLPVFAFINLRFPTQPPANHNTIMREALLVSIYFAAMAWLQLGRALTPALMLLLAFGLLMVEILIRLREKARWQP